MHNTVRDQPWRRSIEAEGGKDEDVMSSAGLVEENECETDTEMSMTECASNIIAATSCPTAGATPLSSGGPYESGLSTCGQDGLADALELGLVADEAVEPPSGLASPRRPVAVQHHVTAAASPGPSPNKRYRCKDPELLDPATLTRNKKLCQAAKCVFSTGQPGQPARAEAASDIYSKG